MQQYFMTTHKAFLFYPLILCSVGCASMITRLVNEHRGIFEYSRHKVSNILQQFTYHSTQIYSMQKQQIGKQLGFPSQCAHNPPQNSSRVPQDETIQAQIYQLFYLQHQVNHQLLLNNILAASLCNLCRQNHKKSPSSSEASTLDVKLEHNDIVKIQQSQRIYLQKQGHIKTVKINRKARNRDKQSEDQDYDPSGEKQTVLKQKLCQSKNIPKSYAKSIANFCDKQRKYVKQLLNRQQISEQDFYEEVKRLKISVKSIHQLKSMWMPSIINPYSKVMRIISMEYLRKHALHYIFGSRIQNYGKHVKYRQTMIRGVQNPQSFNYMKEF